MRCRVSRSWRFLSSTLVIVRGVNAGFLRELSSRGCWVSSRLQIELGLVRALDQLPGDDDALELRGALVDPEQPGVAVEALDRGFAHIAHPALDLHALVRDASQRFGSEELRRGGAELAVGPGIPALCGREHEGLRGGGV